MRGYNAPPMATVPPAPESPSTQRGTTPHPTGGSRLVSWSYRLFPALLLPAMLFLSRDFGITWDEKTHQMYGEAVWRFITHGADSHWFHPDWYMYLHGGLFDALCAAAQRLLPGDPWTIRHYVNAAFGWLGVLYVGRTGRLLGGTGAGLLAMVLLTASPRYFADSMNNPKDLPFAALMAAAIYYILRLRTPHPYVRLRDFVPLTLSIAIALDVRAGGLLLLGYLALALAGLTLGSREFKPRKLASTAGIGIAISVVAVVAGTTFWPWARIHPLTRPFQAISLLSGFDWPETVLYRGADVRASGLPLDYVPRWAVLTTPPVVLAGALLSLFALRRRQPARWRVIGLWVAVLFPALYVIFRHAIIYDGIRHLLFAYPPLVALAAAGWSGLVASRARSVRLAALTVLAAGLAEPTWFAWRNHPNECVYFNALAGGPSGALGRYELDYWANSVHQAVAWIARAARTERVRIVLSGHPPHVVRDEARRNRLLEFARGELHRDQLDVVVLRGPRPDVLELAARRDALYRVTTADGTPLAIVIPGPAYDQIAALPAFELPAGRPPR
jgi:hypothetical protein